MERVAASIGSGHATCIPHCSPADRKQRERGASGYGWYRRVVVFDSEDLLSDGFLIYASTIAVKKSRTSREAPYTERENIPLELQCVLQLSPALRHCFVLRILLGMSVDEVSRITQSEAETVLENTYAAVLALSIMNCSGTASDQPANRAELQNA